MIQLLSMEEVNHIRKQKKYVLDFFSNTCVSCKSIEKLLFTMEKASNSTLKVYKINVENDNLNPIIKEFNVRSLPTIVFMKNSKPENIVIGFNPKDLDMAFKEYMI